MDDQALSPASPDEPSRPVGRADADRRPDLFFFGALAAHLGVLLSARIVAWPEVTTPAYLMARGMLLYRDIKFVHTPGLMALLALCFALFGVSAAVVRGFAILGPLVAHAMVLKETRHFSISVRLLSSALFLVLLLDWAGNSDWPTVLMTPLALPIASALSRGRPGAAGREIGAAILIKQTAAYLLPVCVIGLLWKRRSREIWPLLLWTCLPYAVVAGLFGLLGAGREFLEWTLVVPFLIKESIASVPTATFLGILAAVAAPLAIEARLEKPGEYAIEASWLLAVAIGFLLMSYPRFGPMQAIASIPCFVVGAARLLARKGTLLKPLTFAAVAAVVVSRGAVFAAGANWDGKVVFWNDDPAFNKLVERLETFPPNAPLAAAIWPNVLPRTGRLPPGRIYYHPWLRYLAPIDSIGQRVLRESQRPGTIVVRGSDREHKVGLGPYVIERR